MFHVNGSRKCEICGEVFNRISYNQRYCGEKCKREANILRSREKRRTEKLSADKNQARHAFRSREEGKRYGAYIRAVYGIAEGTVI